MKPTHRIQYVKNLCNALFAARTRGYGSLADVKRHDYLPFGEEILAGTGGRTTTQGYTGDSVRQHYTGYEADDETGLNFAEARYQSPTQGRFTSVDPLGASASVADPQSFNRYSYVNNNPTNLTDPSGMQAYDASNSYEEAASSLEAEPFNPNRSHFGGPAVLYAAGLFQGVGVMAASQGGSTANNGEGEVDGASGETAAPNSSTNPDPVPEDTIDARSATLAAGTETVTGNISDYSIVFTLTTKQQVEAVYSGNDIQIKLALWLPSNAANMTPTTETVVKAPSDVDLKNAARGVTGKSTQTMTSGSKVTTQEGSNFRAGKVTFSEMRTVPNKTITASFFLIASEQRANPTLNTATIRLEGRTDKGQIFRRTMTMGIRVQITN